MKRPEQYRTRKAYENALRRSAAQKERDAKAVYITERTDFSTDWCVFTDEDHPPWALEGEGWEDPTLYHNWN